MLNDGEDIFEDVMSFKAQFNNIYDVLNAQTRQQSNSFRGT